jgi:FkbM family methyltransferase
MNYFLDVGANTGQTFDWHLCQTNRYDGWEILCFEPSPRHLAALLGKAQEMSARFKVTVLPFAISGKSGVMELYEKEDERGDSLHAETWMHGPVVNRAASYRVKVASVRLSDFLLACTKEGDRVEVKLDVEGAEYGIARELLQSPAAIRRISLLHVEWHGMEAGGEASRTAEIELMKALNDTGLEIRIWPH